MAYTEAQRQACKRWYDKHKEEIAIKRKPLRKKTNPSYYKTRVEKLGKEEINRQAKEYREKNPERVRENLRRNRRENPERNLLNRARIRAIEKNLEFNLELSDIVIPPLCPYLQVPIKKADGVFDYAPSIDRIDNTKGYIKGNIEVVSLKANQMKNRATVPELIQFAESVLKKYRDIGTSL